METWGEKGAAGMVRRMLGENVVRGKGMGKSAGPVRGVCVGPLHQPGRAVEPSASQG